MRGERQKREARTALVEYLEGLTVLFVFRGGWIDAITIKRGLKDLEELSLWLKEMGYLEELGGIMFGEGFRSAFGEKAGGEYLGIPVVNVSPRNRKDAEVILEGIRRWLDEFFTLPDR